MMTRSAEAVAQVISKNGFASLTRIKEMDEIHIQAEGTPAQILRMRHIV